MAKSFEEIVEKVKNQSRKKIAVAAVEDEFVLQATKEAIDKGIVDAILIEDEKKIVEISQRINLNVNVLQIIDETDINKAALKAVELVSSGKADMLMKGLVETSTILKAVLNKETGLRTGKLMSHVGVFEIPGFDRLIFITDEMSLGQMVEDVKLSVNGRNSVHFYGRTGGMVPQPEEIFNKIKDIVSFSEDAVTRR